MQATNLIRQENREIQDLTQIQLQSSDGEVIIVDSDIAQWSSLIHSVALTRSNEIVNLPGITADIINMVIWVVKYPREGCQNYRDFGQMKLPYVIGTVQSHNIIVFSLRNTGRGWSPKFATGLNIIIGIVQKV